MEISIVWFRRDLRLIDNEAVWRAAADNKRCLFVFVIDPWFFSQPEIGWLRVKFLFESLASLHDSLQKYGNRLVILRGNSVDALTGMLNHLKNHGWQPSLYVNRDIQVEYGRQRDEAVAAYCTEAAIPLIETNNYFLLHHKTEMESWWRQYYDYQYDVAHPMPDIAPSDVALLKLVDGLPQLKPSALAEDLNVQLPDARQALFSGGEQQARQAVYTFLKGRVNGYRWKLSRPMLAQNGATSLLGPHLAFGTISNRSVFQAAVNHMHKLEKVRPKNSLDIAIYLDRLRWRDSFTQRLWFHPELIWQNRFPEFDALYSDAPLAGQALEYFERWKQGETGFPLLDAAMKQLATDGFINFRMRAMSATFLTVNCSVSWHHGARHFMNCLVDGDIAINHWQWQMQAGITNPLSPTFRMYNPSKNLQDRDPNADYVHFWLPSTAGKDVKTILKEAEPMLDFAATRKQNGKQVSDLRKTVRARIISEKGLELKDAETAHRVVTKYMEHSARRYKDSKGL